MSLTTSRSIKLYDHLTSKQKAVIALGIDDPAELAILAGTIQHKTYRMMDADFVDWSTYAFDISAVLGMAFWKSRAAEYQMRHSVRGMALVAGGEDALEARERDLLADVRECIPRARANQKAALEALQALAQESGFNFEDCLKLADIELDDVDRLDGVEPNQERLDYLLSSLRAVAPKA